MSALERYWLAPIPAVRAWLVLKSTLLLFAIDVFAEHLRPAWRYGTADFNVAHFRIFDLLPMPTSALYVGTLTVTGLLAFVAALSPRPPRPVLIIIAALYFWSWSCSMHDSYQHHYLLSLFFFAFALFPLLRTSDLFGWPSHIRPPAHKKKTTQPQKKSLDDALPHGLVPRASAFGLVVVWTTSAIVYGYTAVSKTEIEWRTGEALRNLTRNGATIPGAVDLFAAFGIEGDALWPFLGHSVIALQVAIALGYLAAPLREQVSGRPLRVLNVLSILVLALALSFHLGAEYMGLQIGWFSWYMILLALATFLPARMLSAFVLFVSWPVREVVEMASSSREPSPVHTAALALVSAIVLVPVGMDLDLPGALAGSMVIALTLMGAALFGLMRSKWLEETRAAALALMIGAALVPFSIRYLGGEARTTRDGQAAPTNDVRYDYYRFAGGDFRRRGEWARALDAYLKADEYAPEGQSRRAQADEMRARMEQEGPRRAER